MDHKNGQTARFTPPPAGLQTCVAERGRDNHKAFVVLSYPILALMCSYWQQLTVLDCLAPQNAHYITVSAPVVDNMYLS